MKQITLSVILLLTVCSAFAQSNIKTKSHPKTVEKLFQKYKAAEGCSYNDLTDAMKNFDITESESDIVAMANSTKININVDDLNKAGVDAEQYFRSIEKFEVITVKLSSDENSMLTEDIKNLKGYECVTQSNFNLPESKTQGNVLKELAFEAFDVGAIKTDCYCKEKGDYIEDILEKVEFFGSTILTHIKGKLNKDLAAKLLMMGMDNPYENIDINFKTTTEDGREIIFPEKEE